MVGAEEWRAGIRGGGIGGMDSKRLMRCGNNNERYDEMTLGEENSPCRRVPECGLQLSARVKRGRTLR
jgi:hypothetical protein